MKIKLYKKAPKCPKCKVPMKFESMTYSDEIQKKKDCKHEWLLKKKAKARSEISNYECEKCGHIMGRQLREEYDESKRTEEQYNEALYYTFLFDAKIYRCPKCLDLYKVEEQDA